jgi:glycosyltransferase involved in cell wall biosynthesis
MFVTVAICTWNRAKLLDRTLTDLESQRIPDGVEWELLVVNNHCTDDTDDVIARHADRLPIRRLFEKTQGSSHARNCAIEAARGELLIWVDDDVLVPPDWLACYVECARQWPEMAYFGGPVLPWFEVEPPAWMTRNLKEFASPLVIVDYGADVRPMADDEYTVCANMAFRREVLKDFPFSDRFGRVGTRLTGYEDIDVIARLRKRGTRGLWVGNAGVRHFIPKARGTADFLRRWYRSSGIDDWRSGHVAPGPRVFGIPRYLLRAYVQSSVATWFLAPVKSGAWARSFRRAAASRGAIEEILRDRQRLNAGPALAAK